MSGQLTKYGTIILSRACLAMALALLAASPVIAAPQRRANYAGDAQHVPVHGWLHTQGTQLIDQDGTMVVLRGYNSSGMEWGAGHEWTNGFCVTKSRGCWSQPEPQEYDNAAQWGFNVVRLPISWSNLEPRRPSDHHGHLEHHFNGHYLHDLDHVIREFGKRHIAVILSMHQVGWSPQFRQQDQGRTIHGLGFPVWLYAHRHMSIRDAKIEFFLKRGRVQDKFVSVWSYLTKHFRNNPTVVGADILNEPNLKPCTCPQAAPPGDIRLDRFYRRVGRVIHNENPNLLQIFEDSKSTPVSHPPGFANVVYSQHLYPRKWNAGVAAKADQVVERANGWNVPLFIGEFQGVGSEAAAKALSPAGWPAQTAAEVNYLKQKGLSWAYWAYSRASRTLGGKFGKGPINDQLVSVLQQGF